jgi:hypothetical protein
VIVELPGLIELVIVAEYVPSPFGVAGPIRWPGSEEENLTVAPTIGLELNKTVAVAVDVEVPSATIEPGESDTVTLFAGSVCCRVR